jgi:hypothetical protein
MKTLLVTWLAKIKLLGSLSAALFKRFLHWKGIIASDKS